MRISLLYSALIWMIGLLPVHPMLHAQTKALDAIAPVMAGELPWATLEPTGQASECVTPAQRRSIQERLHRARLALPAEPTAAERSAAVRFRHPMVWKADLEGLYHAGVLTAQADHNPLSGSLDYACGARSCDGHTGTDYMAFPFPWWAMDQDLAEVVAAAPGKILLKDDGHFDRNCSLPDSNWNAVYIIHSDGSVAWYGHLKSGSLTAKAVGESVAAGEYLGIAGSSGRSTGPHLHFELRDASGNWLDPYEGGCGNAADSWWLEQRPYRDTRIAAVGFHASIPDWLLCADPGEDAIDWRHTFYKGDEAYIGVYLQAPYTGLDIGVRVLDPMGRVATILRHDFAGSAVAGFALFSLDLAHSDAYGTWTVDIQVGDETVVRTFDYCFNDAVCACRTPTGSRAVYQGSASYGLYWDPLDEAVAYRIQKKGPRNSTLELTSTNYDLTELDRGGSYRFRVRSMCGPIGSAWGPWVSMTVPSMDERPEAEHAMLRHQRIEAYTLYNALGQQLWSGTEAPQWEHLHLAQEGTWYILETRRGSSVERRMVLR
jgi:hypothetical protein